MLLLHSIILVCMVIATGYAQTTEPLVKAGRYIPELYRADRGRYQPDDSGKYYHMAVPYDGGYGDRGAQYVNDLRGFVSRPPSESYGNVGVGDVNIGTGYSIKVPNVDSFKLGPNDRLRFMIDFNYNSSGWQIVQFEWIRDGDEQKQYNYVNENKLWHDDYDGTSSSSYSNGVKPYEDSYVVQEPGSELTGDNVPAEPVNYDNMEVASDQGMSIDVKSHAESHNDYPQDDANNVEQAGVQYAPAVEESISTSVHIDGDGNQETLDIHYDNGHEKTIKDPKALKAAISEVLEYIQNHILPTLN